jgi:hypothetical protein
MEMVDCKLDVCIYKYIFFERGVHQALDKPILCFRESHFRIGQCIKLNTYVLSLLGFIGYLNATPMRKYNYVNIIYTV